MPANSIELRIDGAEGALHGLLVGLSVQEALVRLHQPLAETATLTGASVALTLSMGSALVTGTARVMQPRGEDLCLKLTSPLAKVQRRKLRRVPCDLAVAYRTRDLGGRVGAWKGCGTFDLGAGGMCLKLEARIENSSRLELSFRLADSDSEPVRVTGQVVSQRIRCGNIAAGVRFSTLTPTNMVRIAHFIG